MSSGAGNSGEQPVSFKLSDAQRIAKAVGEFESGRRGRRGSTLPRAAGGGGGGGGGIQFATFNGNWPKNTYKVVTLNPANTTASAYNATVNISYAPSGSGSSVRKCALAVYSGTGPSGNSGEYVLIMAECF